MSSQVVLRVLRVGVRYLGSIFGVSSAYQCCSVLSVSQFKAYFLEWEFLRELVTKYYCDSSTDFMTLALSSLHLDILPKDLV
jgi:hypothetical protein